MIEKVSMTCHKCSFVNYGIVSFKYFMKIKLIMCCTCHHNFMDLKYWPYFKVKYKLDLMMIFIFFAQVGRTLQLKQNYLTFTKVNKCLPEIGSTYTHIKVIIIIIIVIILIIIIIIIIIIMIIINIIIVFIYADDNKNYIPLHY